MDEILIKFKSILKSEEDISEFEKAYGVIASDSIIDDDGQSIFTKGEKCDYEVYDK